ncbi:MAG: PadR family transcriptional regulator [Gemmatimonadota bacterium]|nr:PadR family transcriptional regulator [Gemmatimonadota bacterium]
MSLDHILLGMLQTPAAGYDLGREFDESARMFWSAELSQIYQTLKRLERKDYLTSEEVPSDRGPNRKVYHRTDEGRRALEEWLREPPELGSQRLPYVAQFFYLGQLDDPEASRAFVERLREELIERLGVYAEIDRAIREECDDPFGASHESLHRYATLRAGIHVAEARVAWCDETLAALRARADASNEVAAAGVTSDTGAG